MTYNCNGNKQQLDTNWQHITAQQKTNYHTDTTNRRCSYYSVVNFGFLHAAMDPFCLNNDDDDDDNNKHHHQPIIVEIDQDP